MALLLGLASTALLGIILFYVAPPLSNVLEELLSDQTIKLYFLFGLLALYLLFAQLAWEGALYSLKHQRDNLSLARIISRALFDPIRFASQYLYEQIYKIFDYFLFRHLHADLRIIIRRAYSVFILVWISVFGVLLFANLWKPADKACAWKFPKILTCVLTNYENLAGGVIGAGGAIFAGWLAWLAVQQQLAEQRKPDGEIEPAGKEPIFVGGRPQLPSPYEVVAPHLKPHIWQRLLAAVGSLFLAFLVIQLLMAAWLTYLLPGDRGTPDKEIAIQACLPLQDARVILRNRDDASLTDEVLLRERNDTYVRLKNELGQTVGPVTLRIRFIPFGHAANDLLHFQLRSDDILQSSTTSIDAHGAIIQLNQWRNGTSLMAYSVFSHPIALLVEIDTDGRKERKFFNAQCSIEIPTVSTLFHPNIVYDFTSSRCKPSGSRLECEPSTEVKTQPSADEIERIIVRE
jgi:hypothetical protein